MPNQLKLLHGTIPQILNDGGAQSDMGSDSRLSKSIRPGRLVCILMAQLLFALLLARGIDSNGVYVKLLGEWGQLVMLAYFGGRSVEKIFEMRMHSSNKKEEAT